MSKDTLMYPIHHLDLTEKEWSYYDEMRAAKESNNLTDVMKLQAKLSPGEFARIGGGEWTALLAFKILGSEFGADWLALTALMTKMKVLKSELAGPTPTAVESVLADLVTIAWADWHRCLQHRECLEDCTFRQATYHDQRVDRSHKRLVRSLRALAAVRKVDLTAVQINLNGVAGQLGDPASRRAQRAEESLVDEPILAD